MEINVVEALVPEECFRYERDPRLHPKVAEKLWASTRKGRGGNKAKMRASNETLSKIRKTDEHLGISLEESELMTRCRDEAKISSSGTDKWTCGAKCGFGQYEGSALYPQRFSLNVSSHIEWYLSRGVEIHVVLSVRDPTISHLGKMKDHCHLDGPGQKEGQVAIDLMQDAILKSDTRGRVIVSSYEALMTFKEAYLFGLYTELGIESTFIPSFHGGNTKYITRAHGSYGSADERPEPSGGHNSTPAEFVVPERLIVVVGTGSMFLANSLAIATGALDELAGANQNSMFLTSRDGKFAVQHLSLPVGRMCNTGEGSEEAVQFLLPQVCGLNTTLAESCRERLKVDVESTTYPSRVFVNLTSHLEFWLKLGVETSIILVARDNDIVLEERLRDCPVEAIAQNDNERAISIMKEVYESQTLYAKQYPMRRNRLSDAESQRRDRVIFAYYEGFMLLGQAYLLHLYRQLGISSSHAPEMFVDENTKYISDPKSAKMANEGASDASVRHKKGLAFAKKRSTKR